MKRLRLFSVGMLSSLLLISLLFSVRGLADATTVSRAGPYDRALAYTEEYTDFIPESEPRTSKPFLRPKNGSQLAPLSSALLTVTKRTAGTLIVGNPITYYLTITNTSATTAATNVVVNDTLPAGISFVSAGSGGALSGTNVVSWTIASISTNGNVEVSFQGATAPACPTSLSNALYRAVQSDEGFYSDPGPPLATTLQAPTINPAFTINGSSASSVMVTVGDSVSFSGSASTNGSQISSYGWNFGDTGTASGATASHTYTVTGDYSVRLTATDDCNYAQALTKTVQVRAPDLQVTKTALPEPVEAGTQLQYTVVVDNIGPVGATGVVISDPLPPGVQFVPGSINLTGSGTAGSQPPTIASGVSIPNGQQVQVTFNVTITVPSTNGLQIPNTVSVVSDQVATPTITTANSLVSTTPVISVVKEGPSTAFINDVIEYRFRVTNSGNTLLHRNKITVIDDIAGTGGYQSGDDGDNWLEFTETWIYTAPHQIALGVADPLINTVTVSATDEGTPSQMTSSLDSHQIDIDHRPVLQVTKSGPANASVGDSATFNFDVSHAPSSDNSAVGGASITVVDNVAGNAAYSSGDDGDNQLEGGEQWRYQVTYTIPPTVPNILTNQALLNWLDKDGDPWNANSNTHNLDVAFNPVLQVVKTGPPTANVDDTVTYVFTVSHATGSDDSPANTVTIVDSLAAPVTLNGKLNGDTDTQLEVGELWVYEAQYTIQPEDPNIITNVATITWEDQDVPADQGQAASNVHQVDVDFMPALSINKTGPPILNLGNQESYFISISHNGSLSDKSPIDSISVTDPTVSTISYWMGDDQGQSEPRNFRLDIGETWIYLAFYTPKLGDPSPFVNTATVTGLDKDGESLQASDSHTATIDFSPALKVEKVDPDTAAAGEQITYQFEVTVNGDNSSVTNLVVTDTIAGMAFYVTGDANSNSKLDLNETWIFTASYTVKVDDPDLLVGTVYASGNDENGDPVSKAGTHNTPVTIAPAVQVVKTGPSIVLVGEVAQYSFQVSHAPTSDGTVITDIMVSDDLAGSATYTGGDLDNDQELDQNEIWAYTATHTVTLNDADPLINNVTVTARNRRGGLIAEATDIHQADIDFRPRLQINTTSPAAAYVGESITFNFVVNNDSMGDGSPVSNVMVVDDFAGQASYVAGDDGDNVLETGENWSFSAPYIVKLGDPDPLVHQGTVSGLDADGESIPVAQNSASIDITGAPAFDVTIDGPAEGISGRPFIYTITVTNVGTVMAHNLVITDMLPANATYISGGSLNGNHVQWTVNSLPVNDNQTVTFVASAVKDTVNDTFGAKSDGDVTGVGKNSVATVIKHVTYLPATLNNWPEPMTTLFIFNDNTGGNVTVNIINPTSGQIVVTCTIPNNATQKCGTFSPGKYNIQVIGQCGNNTFPDILFVDGEVTRRTFCEKLRK